MRQGGRESEARREGERAHITEEWRGSSTVTIYILSERYILSINNPGSHRVAFSEWYPLRNINES